MPVASYASSWLPQRCWPQTEEDWHGTVLAGLWTGMVLSLAVWGFDQSYLWCDVFAGVANTQVTYLLARALFRQASLADFELPPGAQRSSTATAATTESAEYSAQQQRMLDYGRKQAERWNNFVVMNDDGVAPAVNNNSQRLQHTQQQQQQQQATRVKMGPFPIPYSSAAIGTLVLNGAIFQHSLHHNEYYISLTQLSSTVDWFRTLFLLSMGVLGASFLLYMLPTLIFVYKTLAYHCNRCWSSSGEGGDDNDDKNNSTSSSRHSKEEGLNDHTSTNDNDSASRRLDSDERVSTSSRIAYQHPPVRTASDTARTTLAAMVLAAASLALTIVFFSKRWRYIHQVQPAMNWKRGTTAIVSYQGDAWVTGFQVTQDRQVWCESPHDDAVKAQVTVAWGGEWACPQRPDTYCETTIEAQVSCILAPNALTMEANNNNDNNNQQQQEEQEQADDDGNGGEGDNADNNELYFATVNDYVKYRYTDREEENNNNDDDQYNNDDDQNNNNDDDQNNNNNDDDQNNDDDDFGYDPDEPPHSVVNGAISWNRQAEFIVGNCDNCQARSLAYINGKFPAITRALHGFWPSVGSLLFSVAWVGLAHTARQVRAHKQPTDNLVRF